ncbi:MAG: hypothetical protein ACXAC0_10085 [Candidatus Thorarchaeota archaeon]
MSITMMGLLVVLSVPIIIPPPQIPMKYNTENVIVKFNDSGELIWDEMIPIANATSKILFEPGSICIINCEGGGYAIASPIKCQRNDVTTWGVQLCRISESGIVIWKHVFEGVDIELDLSLVEFQSEGFVIAGTSQSLNEESNSWIPRVFLIRTDSLGNHQWNRSYTEFDGVCIHSLVACVNGDLAIGGTTETHSDEGSNVLLARIAENGNFLWKTFIGGSLNEEGNSLLECSDGGFVIVGSTQIEENDKDVLIVRTAANGSIIWNRTYEDVGISIGLSVCTLDNGGFAVTGLRKPFLTDSYKILFLVVTSDGEQITKETLRYPSEYHVYGIYDDCRGHAIIQSNDDGFIIAGIVRYNHLTNEWGMMILRTDTKGEIVSNSVYGENSLYMACSLVTCENQGITVAGVRVFPVG